LQKTKTLTADLKSNMEECQTCHIFDRVSAPRDPRSTRKRNKNYKKSGHKTSNICMPLPIDFRSFQI